MLVLHSRSGDAMLSGKFQIKEKCWIFLDIWIKTYRQIPIGQGQDNPEE